MKKSIISTMSVDVFCRQKEVYRGLSGIRFTLTTDANFGIQNKRLCNVETAVEPTDAVNLKSLNTLEQKLQEDLEKLRKSFKELENKFNTLKNRPKTKKIDLTLEEQERILTNKV